MAIAQADGRANSEINSRSKNRVNRTFPAILHQKSCPPTPEQKGLAERQHRHIVEQRLATMYKASIPLKQGITWVPTWNLDPQLECV